MEYTGHIRKMQSELKEGVVAYHLPLDEQLIDMNNLIGRKLSLAYQDEIACIRCGRITAKSYHQGYCYPCFRVAPETDSCMLHPETCRAQDGISRDREWSRTHCLVEHIVYLSLTSDVKVGVTRHTQLPVRWIDQGATQALVLARVPNRYTAGCIEVALKKVVKDKTNWRNMLSGKHAEADLVNEKERLKASVPVEFQECITTDSEILPIQYPGTYVPEKVKAWNPDKEPVFSGQLVAIKGQYLIFSDNTVWNVRKHNGYLMSISVD